MSQIPDIQVENFHGESVQIWKYHDENFYNLADIILALHEKPILVDEADMKAPPKQLPDGTRIVWGLKCLDYPQNFIESVFVDKASAEKMFTQMKDKT